MRRAFSGCGSHSAGASAGRPSRALDIDEGPPSDRAGRRWKPSTLAAEEAAEQAADRSDGQRTPRTARRWRPRPAAAVGRRTAVQRRRDGLDPAARDRAQPSALWGRSRPRRQARRAPTVRREQRRGATRPTGVTRVPRPPEPLPPVMAETVESRRQLKREMGISDDGAVLPEPPQSPETCDAG